MLIRFRPAQTLGIPHVQFQSLSEHVHTHKAKGIITNMYMGPHAWTKNMAFRSATIQSTIAYHLLFLMRKMKF